MVDKNLKLSDLTGSQKTNDGLNKFKQDSNVFLQAITNVPSSAKKFVKDVVTPFLNPIQTAKDLGSLGSSVVNLISPSLVFCEPVRSLNFKFLSTINLHPIL